MSKKRVYEIAKEQGLSSKELLDRLTAAGVDVKAAASSVEETLALKALGDDDAGAAGNGKQAAAQQPASAGPAPAPAPLGGNAAARPAAPAQAPAPASATPAPAVERV